jgi:hypothetical protein
MDFRNFLFTVLFTHSLSAQWEGGASFNYKCEIPEKGVGVFIARNLPVQFALFGIKARAGIDHFFANESDKNIFNVNVSADLVTTLFYRDIHPYLILSFGGSHYSVNDFNDYLFTLGAGAGIKFPLSTQVQPFIEINSIKFFSNFDEEKTGRSISSAQLAGKAGIAIKF